MKKNNTPAAGTGAPHKGGSWRGASLIEAVSGIMDFCNPTEDRGQWLAFAMKEPRQMFVHVNLWTMFAGDGESDERWIEEHTPPYPFNYLKRRWQGRKRSELRIKHTEWCLKFLHAAVGALNVCAGVNGLPYHDLNGPLDVFLVVGDGDENRMIDTSNLEHTEPILHFVFRGGHIEHMQRYDAEFEQMVNRIDREEQEAKEKEAKRVEEAKKNGNPLAGTEYEILGPSLTLPDWGGDSSALKADRRHKVGSIN